VVVEADFPGLGSKDLVSGERDRFAGAAPHSNKEKTV
jgi:hypothetical protein